MGSIIYMIWYCLVFSCVKTNSFAISRFLDLSHPFNRNTHCWDPTEKFALTKELVRKEPFFYAVNNFATPEHCGTHLDAPYHFKNDGWTVDQIPLDRLISPGVLLDISHLVKDDSNFELLPQHLIEWEAKYGNIPNGVILIVKFGWSRKYKDREAYFGNLTMPYSFPGISNEASKWIANHGGIYGVGLDSPSTDAGKSTTFETHQNLANGGIFSLENLNLNRDDIPTKGFRVMALPVNIMNGTGGPCRVIVELPNL